MHLLSGKELIILYFKGQLITYLIRVKQKKLDNQLFIMQGSYWLWI